MTKKQQIKQLIGNLSEGQIRKFKHIYSGNNPDLPINEIIDGIAAKKVAWALTQIENTLKNNRPKQTQETELIDF